MWWAIIFMGATIAAACSAPVAAPAERSGEAIAFGAGPGGPQDACFSCHGLKGEGDSSIPRLAGLSTGYLLKQLEDYAGRWRDEPAMTSIARRMSDGDRLAVAAYYAALPNAAAKMGKAMEHDTGSRPAAAQAPAHALFENGDPVRNLAACASCHAPDGKDAGLATPVLAGQSATYIRAQLQAWKDSRRRNDPRDVMGDVARKLTVQEIAALADYVKALP